MVRRLGGAWFWAFSPGISAGAGAGRGPFGKLHPDYLTGLDYLVTEQPDRALDMFLKLMDANADTIETHFALGSLYRRRGEVERAIRIHQNLLAREALAPEHREQALLALAQDYLRAGLLDRAEALFQQVSEVPRLRASALDSLRGVYERQHEWQQALDTYRQLGPHQGGAAQIRGRPLSVRNRQPRDRARRDPGCAELFAPGAARDRAVSARRAHARADRGARRDSRNWRRACCAAH